MKISEYIQTNLPSQGWDVDELLYEQQIRSQHSESGYRAAVMLVHRSYFLGIIDTPPIAVPVTEYVQQLYSSTAGLGIPSIFVFLDGQLYRLEHGGELALDKPVALTLDYVISCALPGGEKKSASDPRFAAAAFPRQDLHLSVWQVLAVSRTLDSLARGERIALIQMPTGTGKTLIQTTIVSKLIHANAVSRVLVLTPLSVLRDFLVKTYRDCGMSVAALSGNDDERARVIVATLTQLHMQSEDQRSRIHEEFDIVVVDEAHHFDDKAQQKAFGGQQPKLFIGLSAGPVLFSPFSESVSYKYNADDILDDLPIPPGYDGHELGSFATVQTGIHVLASSGDGGDVPVSVISARNIEENGTLTLDSHGSVDSLQYEQHRLDVNDILVSAVGATRKIAYIDSSPAEQLIFTSSLIRIRTADPRLAPALFKFLSSSLGRMTLDKLSYGMVQKVLTVSEMRKMLIYFAPGEFLDEEMQGVAGEREEDAFTTEQSIIEALKSEVIPALEELSRQDRAADDLGAKSIASRLNALAMHLSGRSIEEHVLESFPSPIALAFRRYRDARFNVFEQVLRLRDLAEACSFFIYNVFLVDYFRSLATLGYSVQDKGARKAYTGFSMAARIDFVAEILVQSEKKPGTLFLAEMTQFRDFARIARSLNEDLRNSLSHTAAASESQQSAILQRFVPVVMGYLEELKFLTGYRLARIPEYYAKNGKFLRRVEVYTGVSPYIGEEAINVEDVDARISRDHLVLMSPEKTVLNLHPLYQLISNVETRHENHLCLFKQRKNGQLQGESVHGSFSIDLNDAEYFENLIPPLEG